jgi:hypothetical protein
LLRFGIILSCFCFPFHIFAQNSWQAKYYTGFLVPHHEDMQQMQAHIFGFELGRNWKVDSGGIIDKNQHHPNCGISLHYFNLGKAINGHSFALLDYYETGFRLGKKSSLRIRLSTGIGYLTQDFNIYTNPTNRAIGSKINAFMQILAYWQTPIFKQYSLQLGLGMSHFSNGNWSQPNLGINLPAITVGLNETDKKPGYLNVLKKYSVPQKIQWQFFARMGKREIGIDNPTPIVNYLLETVCVIPHNPYRQWRLGFVAFFDRSYIFTKFQPLPQHPRLDQITELALQIGHEYRIGKFGFVTDLGLYLYRPNQTKRMYYEGIGIKYYITPNWIIMNRLKAHLSTADYFEWGVGYNLIGKKNQAYISDLKK